MAMKWLRALFGRNPRKGSLSSFLFDRSLLPKPGMLIKVPLGPDSVNILLEGGIAALEVAPAVEVFA